MSSNIKNSVPSVTEGTKMISFDFFTEKILVLHISFYRNTTEIKEPS